MGPTKALFVLKEVAQTRLLNTPPRAGSFSGAVGRHLEGGAAWTVCVSGLARFHRRPRLLMPHPEPEVPMSQGANGQGLAATRVTTVHAAVEAG